jgi:hypothetical protein
MRHVLPILLLSALPLAAQSALVSVTRQPKATAAEFTVPITDFLVKSHGDSAHFHVGVGLGFRHWDDGDTALRFVVDANALAGGVFAGFGAIVEVPPGEGAFIGPRLRVGWAFHPAWALSLEGEHLERPFTHGLTPRRRSNLGLALTVRF